MGLRLFWYIFIQPITCEGWLVTGAQWRKSTEYLRTRKLGCPLGQTLKKFNKTWNIIPQTYYLCNAWAISIAPYLFRLGSYRKRLLEGSLVSLSLPASSRFGNPGWLARPHRSSMLVANGTLPPTTLTFQLLVGEFLYILASSWLRLRDFSNSLGWISKDNDLGRAEKIWQDQSCSSTIWLTLGSFIFSELLLCTILFLPP